MGFPSQRLRNGLESYPFPGVSCESLGRSVSLQFPNSEWVVPIKLQSLLVRYATGPDCHLKMNWHISAGDPLIMADLPTVTSHRNTTIPSTTQKGSSNTKCGVTEKGGET